MITEAAGNWYESMGYSETDLINHKYEDGFITLSLDKEGKRKVAKKGISPVIDLCSKKITGFQDYCFVNFSFNSACGFIYISNNDIGNAMANERE